MKSSSWIGAIAAPMLGMYIYVQLLNAQGFGDYSPWGSIFQTLCGLLVSCICFALGVEYKMMVGVFERLWVARRFGEVIVGTFAIAAILGVSQALVWRHFIQTIMLGMLAIMVVVFALIVVEYIQRMVLVIRYYARKKK